MGDINERVAPRPQNAFNIWRMAASGTIGLHDVDANGKVIWSSLQKKESGGASSDAHDDGVRLTCVICWARTRRCVLYPCLHMVSCATCTRRLRKCPICRAAIGKTDTVYLS